MSSNVPKSQRKEYDSVLFHKLFEIQRLITELSINDFGYDQEKFERKIQKYENSVRNLSDDKKQEVVNKMRIKNECFYSDFIDDETTILRDLIRDTVFELELGNNKNLYRRLAIMDKIYEQMIHLNNCVHGLVKIKLELMYIADTIPGDINRYSNLIIKIQNLIDLIYSRHNYLNNSL